MGGGRLRHLLKVREPPLSWRKSLRALQTPWFCISSFVGTRSVTSEEGEGEKERGSELRGLRRVGSTSPASSDPPSNFLRTKMPARLQSGGRRSAPQRLLPLCGNGSDWPADGALRVAGKATEESRTLSLWKGNPQNWAAHF